ncbi:hypothetical protein NQ314_017275 [Rhamnusium bicolor]|uniref:Uncharacterized protein n=1 Tax=Rhamnusium bicolor TaxID=1586634 RepID=A0AAV8WU35_9CUCU|nr:hypothetical protein NQ314_017275 [Rhamnusium bicolor]
MLGSRCNQAIMIITEGVDYDYDINIFKEHNKDKDFPVRIFSYQIGDASLDATRLEWLACANMGKYFIKSN